MARRKKKLDTLEKVMSKVAKGKKLTKHERELLSAMRDGMNLATHSKKDPLARAMTKVAKGEKLTAVDKVAISGAIDAVKSHEKKKKASRKKNPHRRKR